MSGTLTALQYDSATMPLSPCVTYYEAFDRGSRYVFEAKTIERAALRDDFNEFLIQYPEAHHPSLGLLDQGNYTMLVSVEGSPLRPIVVFDFQNNSTGEVFEGVRMDNVAYIEEFAKAGQGKSSFELGVFEMAWSIEYLKKMFGQHVEGTEEFWTKFTGDLDVAMMPANLQREMMLQGVPYKPVIVDKSHAVFEAEH